MRFKTVGIFWFILTGFFLRDAVALEAAEKIKIVATTSTFASLTEAITGDRAEVYFIASPKQNIHYIAPTPRDVMKVKRADVFVHAGLDLELAWRQPMLNAAANPRFLSGDKYSIDVSRGVRLLEVPASVSRAGGDIHLYGNPHYWMDPENAKVIVKNIADGLSGIYPGDAALFQEKARRLIGEIDAKIADWSARMARFKGAPVVTYHRNWIYFTERFGLEIAGELEPKPGIPPAPRHLAELERTMREKGVRVVIRESYQESRSPKKVARETGAEVLLLAQSVGEHKETEDYIAMMEYNIRTLETALGAGR